MNSNVSFCKHNSNLKYNNFINNGNVELKRIKFKSLLKCLSNSECFILMKNKILHRFHSKMLRAVYSIFVLLTTERRKNLALDLTLQSDGKFSRIFLFSKWKCCCLGRCIKKRDKKHRDRERERETKKANKNCMR